MAVEIRIAAVDDAVSACEVLRCSIAECCVEDHRNDASILSIWLGNKTPAQVALWFSSPANLSLVAVVDGDVLGVAMLARSGKIVLFYVRPEARFTGVGKALLRAIETHSASVGRRLLRVNSTFAARDFYLRNGFMNCGMTVSTFGSEAMSMQKKLHAAAYFPKSICHCSRVQKEAVSLCQLN